jgi:hypothetical protein
VFLLQAYEQVIWHAGEKPIVLKKKIKWFKQFFAAYLLLFRRLPYAEKPGIGLAYRYS